MPSLVWAVFGEKKINYHQCSSLFHGYLPLGKEFGPSFSQNKFEFQLPMGLWAKFGWNWPSEPVEDVIKVGLYRNATAKGEWETFMWSTSYWNKQRQ